MLFQEERKMRKFFAWVAACAVLMVIAPQQDLTASCVGAIQKSVSQGGNPPKADSELQQSFSPPKHKDVIPPPPTGDEDIYTDVPNPEAGHEEEVIPPPDIRSEP